MLEIGLNLFLVDVLSQPPLEHPWKSSKEKGTEASSSAEKVPWLKWANKSYSHRSSTMEVEKSAAPATPEFPNRVIFHLKLQSIMAEIWSLSFVNPVH